MSSMTREEGNELGAEALVFACDVGRLLEELTPTEHAEHRDAIDRITRGLNALSRLSGYGSLRYSRWLECVGAEQQFRETPSEDT